MFLLQMSGVPGSGKSTLAHAISTYIDVIIINTDVIKSSILEVADGIDFRYAGKVTYSVAYAMAKDYLTQGKNVILDSPCLYEEGLANGLSISKECNAQYKYVECFLDNLDEIDNRLKQRVGYASQIKEIGNVEAMMCAIYAAKKPKQDEYLVVNTSDLLDSYIEEVIRYLKK